jgi:ferredoxin/flavodoxin---NADP+ reductase
MSEDETLWVAVVGAGPAGYYTAEALTKANENARVDILEKLPTPYGLIRGGVAPDHQSIKNVSRRYEKTSLQDNVRFLGNLEIGRDLSIAELMELYDAVVIATGAPHDRGLNIPGADKAGVVGSAAFVGWYNSHPDFADLEPDLKVDSVVVIGNGNVAVDVVRVLAKTAEEMAHSDLAPYAANVIHPAPIKDIYMCGRRGPIDAKFTTKELGELGQLTHCSTVARADQLPGEVTGVADKELGAKVKNLNHLKAFVENNPGGKPRTLHMEFYARPVEILGDDRVSGIRLERTTVDAEGHCIGSGEMFDVACQMVVPCIGYRSEEIDGVAFHQDWGLFPNDEGHISDHLYTVGWAKRGPSGTIGTNRTDAIAVSALILAEVTAHGKPGGRGLDALIEARSLNIVRFKDWKKIEAAEEKAALGVAPRVKFAHISDMMDIVNDKNDS